MKQLVLIVMVCGALAACGKRPGTLMPVGSPRGESQLAQPYPMVQTAPPVGP